jgi:5'-3' exonuclease
MIFQWHLTYCKDVRRWDLFVVLDGVDPPEKRYERQRRENRENSLRNTSTFIALCAKICHYLQIPYVVAPQEAVLEAVKARPDKDPTIVTGDSDIIAYGSKKTIVMKRWSMYLEEYRIISFVNVSTTEAESLPLYRAYLAFGLDVFAVWAACNFFQRR